MTAAIMLAAAITALAIFFFVVEGDDLSEAHARTRTQVLSAARWAVVIACSWLLIPAATSQSGPDRVATVLGLALLIAVTILVPVRWFVQMGGRDPIWELRRTKTEVSLLANRVRLGKGTVPVSRLEETIARLRALRAPSTAELCDLLAAQVDDLMAGREAWNEAGRRSIRIDELSREIWPQDMPPYEVDADEATFSWRLYRHFGKMMELGSAVATPASLRRYRQLAVSIDEFRRPDTFRFIDAVLQSADRWLANPIEGAPWIDGYDFAALGPDGLEEVLKLWRRDAALWGAHLDDEDLSALQEDIARHAEAAGATEPGKPDEEFAEPADLVVPEPAREAG
ncbi:MAG TPA: hypothetical protein VF337_07155 [Candidatus Limnocylindrales bacterium]